MTWPKRSGLSWPTPLEDIKGNWIKEKEAKGLPGRDVVVTYIEILEELGHEFPREWAAEYR